VERLGAIRKVPGAPVERCTDGYDDSKIRRVAIGLRFASTDPIYAQGRNESL